MKSTAKAPAELARHPKRLLSTAKTSPMNENEYFQPYLPATDIVTIAAISFSF
jgi:hypothetical protein